ncbi:hypothetical protein NLG97_g11087 [Lecanicillium saksenae]|uniref:Uncharacterized protein n=1 Tax=Lecanicillium saksenae TaxID=468837 RepID=A0ACC1QBI7_9HYPO|nr:hypothetical protein NLG97_g11087 [Lecanicillium saksenae]
MSVKDGTARDDAAERDQGDQLEARAAQVDERKLVRKLDLYLIPLIMMLYLFSFLDRYASLSLSLSQSQKPNPPSSGSCSNK